MVMAMGMRRVAGRRIGAGEFKAKCLRLMDQVAATGERIVITKRGKPVAELGPVRGQSGSLLLVATALEHDLTLVTADAKLLAWGGRLKTLNAER